MEDAPDPILPQTTIWPTSVLIVALIACVVATLVHAGRRGRWGWVTAVVLVTPLAVPLYWLLAVPMPRREAHRVTP